MDNDSYIALRSGLIAAMVVAITVVGTHPAWASCAAPPSFRERVEQAEVVFVGKVVATTSKKRWATVKVQDVWKGGPFPATVEVRGGLGQPNVGSSVERYYESGTRYLFFPTDRQPPFRDNICTATRKFDPSLERFAPAGGDLPFTGATLTYALSGVVALIAIGVALTVPSHNR